MVRTKKITFEELIHLKNKIHNENVKGSEDDSIKSKCTILVFFKEIISNLEMINEYMNILRTKGSSLPIKISIKINIRDNKPTIKYYLADNQTEFNKIRDFLFDAKNKYIEQLDSIYKKDLNIRFLYGKELRSIMKHLDSDLNIDSFLRYILNDKNNNKTINEGYKAIKRNVTDYINQYEIYNQNSLDGISAYINSLFTRNNNTIENHLDNMKNVTTNDINYKGIFLHNIK